MNVLASLRLWWQRRVLLSTTEARLLSALGADRGVAGMTLHYRSGVPRGSIYVHLDRLEDRGLLLSWPETRLDGAEWPRRRFYQRTHRGDVTLCAWQILGGVL